MKKIFFSLFVLSISLMLLTSCEAFLIGVGEGYDAGSNGADIYGSTTSQSSCVTLCKNKGRSYYSWSSSTGNCFCK